MQKKPLPSRARSQGTWDATSNSDETPRPCLQPDTKLLGNDGDPSTEHDNNRNDCQDEHCINTTLVGTHGQVRHRGPEQRQQQHASR
jgi:hypothetical protein